MTDLQSDAETARLINTVVAMITGNTDDAGQPTTLLVDPSTPEGGDRVWLALLSSKPTSWPRCGRHASSLLQGISRTPCKTSSTPA